MAYFGKGILELVTIVCICIFKNADPKLYSAGPQALLWEKVGE